MVEVQIRARGVDDEKVLAAMRQVPRHLFVPEELRSFAYGDEPLPIGEGQTISQPYIVAYMTQSLRLSGGEKVLEVGTGSGYQTAVLAEIVGQVFTIELLGVLSERARALHQALGYENIRSKAGDGTMGWEENAPFDAIMVTAAAPVVPKKLQEQLGPEGRMIIPVGAGFQELFLITRERGVFRKKKLLPVRFVPLVSAH
ncbi:MAG: protein-L-isoaspartate O-methyltransferase [Candidatus Aminicenantes bacterium RBG_19FT_COMBO_59_29]|nr:MAG: protein-L-isoaspartate O-methyltransferase [Candidatus Aminicenantes bacterium RBG_19FT_COMBO_59_29]